MFRYVRERWVISGWLRMRRAWSFGNASVSFTARPQARTTLSVTRFRVPVRGVLRDAPMSRTTRLRRLERLMISVCVKGAVTVRQTSQDMLLLDMREM